MTAVAASAPEAEPETPPWVTGPTWTRGADGRFILPARDRTLGVDIAAWMMFYLGNPGGIGPLRLTDEQFRFICWWYAIDDRGRFAYRSGCLRRMKGWGKDPLVAALALADLCAPVVFDGWNADGRPVGRPHHLPWVQIAAVTLPQTRTTFGLFPSMVSDELEDDYGLELHRTVIYSRAGGKIEGVTSSPLALEGARPTLAIANEVQWWKANNEGHEMFNVIEGNVAKSPGGISRWLAICNAHRPSEDSVGERLWTSNQLIEAGKAIDTGLLYDSIDAPPDTPVSEIPPESEDPEGHRAGIAKLKDGLAVARGDSVWLDLDAVVASILDVNNSVLESRRKFLNQINAVEDSWIAPQEWDRCRASVRLQPGEKITMGFDGSKSGDWSALVACRVDDGALFVLGAWDPKHHGGEPPRADIDAHVRAAFERFEVVGFRADLYGFESYVDAWTADYGRRLKVRSMRGKPIAFDMRGAETSTVRRLFAGDCERFETAVTQGQLCHDGNSILRQHVLNARRHYRRDDKTTIRKSGKDSARKIDAAVCAVMAFGLRQEYVVQRGTRGGDVAMVF